MRYYAFLLLIALLVACGRPPTPSPTAVSQTLATPTTTPTPSQTPTLPPTHTATVTHTHTPRPTRTPVPPTLTPSPAPPFTDGYLLFFWDNETHVAYIDPHFPEPSDRPKQDLYMAFPGATPDQWEFHPLLRPFLDWDLHAPSWPRVALSPDQTKIVFNVMVHDYSNLSGIFAHALYVYDLSQNQLIQLTEDHFLLGSGYSWLPDSKNLVYGWGKEIYRINLQDLSPELLVGPFANGLGTMYWSPIGQTLAVQVIPGPTSSAYNIAFFNDETKTLTPITQAVDRGYYSYTMAWNRTGEWFAHNETRTGAGMFLTNSHTFERKTVVPVEIPSASSWAPDGSKLVFTARLSDELEGTFLLELETWETTQIIDKQLLPIWSSDSSRLAFGFLEENTAHLSIWNKDTLEMVDILEMENIYRFYVIGWSPDGEWLLFFATGEEKVGLYVVNKAGGEPYFILDTARAIDPYEVYWLPCSNGQVCGGNDE